MSRGRVAARPHRRGRRALVFAVAAAVLLAGGAAAAVANAGGVSRMFEGLHSVLSDTNPHPRWESGPGLRNLSPSKQADPTSTPDPCTAVIDSTSSDIPTDATGLQNAIARVEANCAKNPQAPGLVNALTHLLANQANHQLSGHGNGSSEPGSDHGNSATHGNGHGSSGSTHGNSASHAHGD